MDRLGRLLESWWGPEPKTASKTASKTAPKTAPQSTSKASPKASAATVVQQERSYRDELIKRLQTQLRLPDVGDVRVKLQVDRTGRVLAFEILDSESSMNAAYIRDIVPTLMLAEFGTRFPGESSHEFLLNLTNEF